MVRETPAWLLTRQDWISDGARRLFLAMKSLADVKTGELAIPGRGEEARWIKPKTIDRKASMCDETRKKYMRELIALGAVRHERKRVTRTIGNRLRAFLGVSRYTLLELKPPIAAFDAASSTAKNKENPESEPQGSVSSTANPSTAKGENDLLRPTSSTVEEIGHEYLSESTKGERARVAVQPGDGNPDSHPRRHQSTTAKSDDDGGIGSTLPPKTKPNSDPIAVDALVFFFSDKPLLFRWISDRILHRSRDTVIHKSGYIKKSLPEFFCGIENEVEEFLMEEAIFLLKASAHLNPKRETHERALLNALLKLRDRHGLALYAGSQVLSRVENYVWENWWLWRT